jgi:hypothetical protein
MLCCFIGIDVIKRIMPDEQSDMPGSRISELTIWLLLLLLPPPPPAQVALRVLLHNCLQGLRRGGLEQGRPRARAVEQAV